MDHRRNFLIFAFNLLVSLGTNAQSYNTSLIYGSSKILQHSKKATFDTPDHSDLIQFDFSIKTGDEKHWQRYWNHPLIGVNLAYIDFGDSKILGNAVGIFPSLGFDIYEKNDFNLDCKLGIGVAYLTKHYDKIDNPLNSAIGSHFNNLTQLSISASQRMYNQFYLTLGGHLTHVSNAKTVTPNSGVNLYGINIGVLKKFEIEKSNVESEADSLIFSRRWKADVIIGYGFSEYSFTGGPKYGTYFINTGFGYKFSPFLKWIIGGDYEYSQSVFQFYFQDFDPGEIARKKATKLAIYSAVELRFGIVGARFQAGYYLPYPDVREVTSTFYTKLNINVYPCPKNWEVQPYFGALLKSHAQVAQYLGLVIGAEI